ncbi:hypothetical protein BHE90_006433 [Fusarium euwallaceae]|uniref:Rhodopsin domain-containing protein n=1 Tax=Fusarium euwallaceae TaxID=1147111 RepID=A0A430LTL9_9HYPO|nr:hypothetical protein BHE90_006433 [Fusarium euwallaceae]
MWLPEQRMPVTTEPMGIAMLVCQGVFTTTGSGHSLQEHPELLPNVPWILQVSFGMQPVYITLLALCKASMLCFFLRVFPTRFMQCCVVCAVFRFIYISTVDLTNNVTGTMPTTILLFILEPNLAILCVSIPMLRPFITMYKKRMGGSRLQESSYGQSSGFGSHTENTKRSKKGFNSDQHSTWELNSYRPHRDGKHDAEVFRIDDESASERNLTAPSALDDEIRVQTAWTVRHD